MKKSRAYQYEMFPFNKVKAGSEVIIYGLGKVGQRYVDQIESTGFCKIMCIIDKNFETLSCFSAKPIFPPQWLEENYSGDIPIVVSVRKRLYRDQILMELKQMGIADELIIMNSNTVAYELNEEEVEECVSIIAAEQETIGTSLGVLKQSYNNIRSCLRIVSAGNLIRVGNANDGGYVMLDSFMPERGIAYSFGIAEDISWDSSMAERGYDIFMYDPTIEDIPYHDDRFHFFRKGIAGIEECSEQYQTLEYFINHNKHENNKGMILKMDVEGAEYEFIKSVNEKTLCMFDQLIFEFHDLHELCEKKEDYLKSILNKLNKTHAPIHVHANNWGDVMWIDNVAFPDVIEVSYVLRSSYEVEDYDSLYLPNDYDRPCWNGHNEIVLGRWNGKR